MSGEGIVVVKEEKKENGLLESLFRLAMFAITVYGAVTALAKVMVRLANRLEEDNEGNEKKRFFTCLGKRTICLEDEAISEIDVTVVAAGVEIDLSDADLSEETFLKVCTLGGNVVIRVPAMVRVNMEGKGAACGFSNMVPTYEDESLPVVYVDAESVGACLKIKIGEE